MEKKREESMLKLLLWKEVLIIPMYTVLFYNFKILFFGLFILDRINSLIISIKSIKIEELIDLALETENKKLIELATFAVISVVILYVLIFTKSRELFMILIFAELIDFIVLKLIK